MAKVGIITDSNSGITQDKAETLGITILPMPFFIDGKEYFEDITLSQQDFYKKLEGGAQISTSQPSPQNILELWEKQLRFYDELVYIPMSSGLSGSCETARILAEDFEQKVQVVDNQRISITMKNSVFDALRLAKRGKSAREIKDILEQEKFNATIYITLDTLSYLKKGGRITPVAATLGTLFKIKPVLQIQGEKLDAFAKARTSQNAKSIMLEAAMQDCMGRISENGKYPVSIGIAHTNNYRAAETFMEEVKSAFPMVKDIYMDPLSLSVSCHIGPGSLAIAASRIIE
ncbi:MAG: DegV family protein [Lachnospiraceae bacterium]